MPESRTILRATLAVACTLLFACASAPGGPRSLAEGYRQARWAPGVTVSFPDACTLAYTSTGSPSHAVPAWYLVPGDGPKVAKTPLAGIELQVGQVPRSTLAVTHRIDICPRHADKPTKNTLYEIGWTLSGAPLYNPFEADQKTPALADGVAVRHTDAQGRTHEVGFFDNCLGHHTPSFAGNLYHYHGWSPCLAALAQDSEKGPSHLLGVAMDGYPIYADRDLQGRRIAVAQLDECNGIFGPTPEFPQGVYHYVLPTGDALRSARSAPTCYRGKVKPELAAAMAARAAVCTAAPTAPPMQRSSSFDIAAASSR